MYEHYFKLKSKPFELLPNPDFLYMSKSHKRALSYLDYGIRERVGFILLTGEIGSGKTTIIRNLIKKHLGNVILSKIFNTKVDSEQLIAMINDDFGLPVKDKDKITMLRELNEFLIDQFIKGNQVVLIIDEAQNLPLPLLEEIRMLSNLETDNAKLLQIILVGQPELRATLASPEMMQLRQRISINCHIQPLSREETEEYILHRLEKAGDRNAVVFSQEAFSVIYHYSRGIPRLINIICDFLLLSAFAEESHEIGDDMVKEIVGDLDFQRHFWGETPPPGPLTLPVVENVPVTAQEQGGEVPSILREINNRLSSLGKESEAARKLTEQVTAKLNILEESLVMHQEQTETTIAHLQKELTTLQAEPVVEREEPATEEPLVKESLFRRIFGV